MGSALDIVNLIAAATSIGGLWGALSDQPRRRWVGLLISILVLLFLGIQYVHHRMYIDQIEKRIMSNLSGRTVSLEQIQEGLFRVDEKDLIEALSGLDTQGKISSTMADAELRTPPNADVRVQLFTVR